jgi:hypothetical protein
MVFLSVRPKIEEAKLRIIQAKSSTSPTLVGGQTI